MIQCCGAFYRLKYSLDVIVYDATGVKEFNAAHERLEPNFGDRFVDLDGNKTGKVTPVCKRVYMSICAHDWKRWVVFNAAESRGASEPNALGNAVRSDEVSSA